jgi:hypothetical protein
MTTISNMTRAAIAVSILAGTMSTVSAAEPNVHVFKPARGISIDVGATKVVGYYLVAAGGCGVTLMMGAMPDADGKVTPGVMRVEVPVGAGRKSLVSTGEGRMVELSCGTGAKLLTVTPRQDVALAVAK